jgi:hypothetical protein
MEKLESLQKRALKWILFEENRSYSPRIYLQKCKDIDILPLSKKFDLNDLIFFHKVVYELVPVYLPSYLSFYGGGSRLRRCHLDRLSIVCSLLLRSTQSSVRSNNHLTKSLFNRTHLLWNILPFDLRIIISPTLFKSLLTKHLWNSLMENDDNSPSDEN